MSKKNLVPKTTDIPIWIQVVIYVIYGFLFSRFLFVKNNIFYEANFSADSNTGSFIVCTVVGTIISFFVAWIFGKVFKLNSNIPLILATSMLTIIVVGLLN